MTAKEALRQIELSGSFTHPHWLAFLCGGLSSAGVSVVSGSALRTGPMQWEGHLLVDGPVEGLDPLALAATRPLARDAAAPTVTWFAVRRLADGQLELRLEAPDALGFLGRLLSRVSLLTLLPTELEIATVDGVIKDRVVLGGIGANTPGEEVRLALEEMLVRLCA